MYKLMSNSIYGKTVVREPTDMYTFTTEQQFNKYYNNNDLIELDVYCENTPNETLLVRSKIHENMDIGKRTKKQVSAGKKSSQGTPFPTLLGTFILAYTKRVMNNFIHAIDGFNKLKVYYTDTDSLFIDGESLKTLKDAGYCGDGFGQGKNDLNKKIMLTEHEFMILNG